MKLNLLRYGMAGLLSLVLVACDDQSDQNSETTASRVQKTANKIEPLSGRLLINNPTGPRMALRGIDFVSEAEAGKTSAKGEFSYLLADTVTFNFLGVEFGPMIGKKIITQNDLATVYCKDAARKGRCKYTTIKNLQRLLLSVDGDLDPSNGVNIPARFNQLPGARLDTSIDEFEVALAQQLVRYGRKPAMLFKPIIGVNLEAAQPESDELGGQPMPFVDLFRIARPFPEYSCSGVTYDEQGWPVTIPASCSTEIHPAYGTPTFASTQLLRYIPQGAIPAGDYTVLFDGYGSVNYSGIATKIEGLSEYGRDVIRITDESIQQNGRYGLRLQIRETDPSFPVRNIRIVMPGGTCLSNPMLRVDSAAACRQGEYLSFADRLAEDRNAIVFNPDYLRFLKDFKLVRTMNLMESSPHNPCFTYKDEAYFACLTQEFNWDQRAKMDTASWGGSYRTPLIERYARGTPLEVVVELANQLERDPWFNIPHNATDDYVQRYAAYVKEHLNPELKAHLEYTNEPWNTNFWSTYYVRHLGTEAGLDTNAFWAGNFYYAQRAVEIFNIWEDEFGSLDRLVRILNTYNANQWQSRRMLEKSFLSVDVIASAPYFYGCWNRSSRSHTDCADETKNPMTISEANTVQDLFRIIDNPENRYGLASTINFMKEQAAVAKDFGVQFWTYEGGQHLTVDWNDSDLSVARKDRLLELIRQANRSSAMAVRYNRLLTAWKDIGGLFTAYTMAQPYHRYGSFGMKETLNQSRFDAPKYNSIMRFQEHYRQCWWEDCE